MAGAGGGGGGSERWSWLDVESRQLRFLEVAKEGNKAAELAGGGEDAAEGGGYVGG